MDRRNALSCLVALGAFAWFDAALARQKLIVIAHAASAPKSLDTGDLEAIFTTRKLYWPSGKRIVPFNFPAKHAVRAAFDRAALQMGPDEVARFWIDRRVRGGNPPPRQIPDAVTMLKVVARLEGAVGYLPATTLIDGVRKLGEV